MNFPSFPEFNWSYAIKDNPLDTVIVEPLKLFEPFSAFLYAILAVFLFGIIYIRSGKLYSAIAYTVTLFAAIMATFTSNLLVSLILYTVALFSLAAALWLTFGKREAYG